MGRSAFLVNFYKIPPPFLWVIPIKIAGAVIFRLHSGPEIWYNREEGGGHGPTVPAKNACGTVSRKKRRVYSLRRAADSGCEEPRRRSKSGRQGRSLRTDRFPGFRPQLSRRKTVGSFRATGMNQGLESPHCFIQEKRRRIVRRRHGGFSRAQGRRNQGARGSKRGKTGLLDCDYERQG